MINRSQPLLPQPSLDTPISKKSSRKKRSSVDVKTVKSGSPIVYVGSRKKNVVSPSDKLVPSVFFTENTWKDFPSQKGGQKQRTLQTVEYFMKHVGIKDYSINPAKGTVDSEKMYVDSSFNLILFS